jgi:hypothetical protein
VQLSEAGAAGGERRCPIEGLGGDAGRPEGVGHSKGEVEHSDGRVTQEAWRSHVARSSGPPSTASDSRLAVEGEVLANSEEDNGWTVLATAVSGEGCTDTEILQAYQEQHTTVEPGVCWIKHPAAIALVWLETPERIAALAMLTVIGLLVYSLIPPLSLQRHPFLAKSLPPPNLKKYLTPILEPLYSCLHPH